MITTETTTKLEITKKRYQDKRKQEKKIRDAKHGDLYSNTKVSVIKREFENLITFLYIVDNKRTLYKIRESKVFNTKWKARFGTEQFLTLYIEVFKLKPFVCQQFEVNKLTIEDLNKIKNDYTEEHGLSLNS